MNRAPLDFLRSTEARGRGPLVLAALGAAALVATTAWMDALSTERDELAAARAQAAPVRPVARTDPRDPSARASARRIEAAQRVVGDLALPWNGLLAAIEKATLDGVALLGVDPDASARTVRLTGEAKDLETTLRYVDRLAAQAPLAQVHLASFVPRTDENEPKRSAIRFTVAAAWLTR